MSENQNGQTPTMVKVLAILTFIGSGLVALITILALIGAATFLANIPGASNLLSGAAGTGIAYVILKIVMCAAAIYGAMQMMKMKKIGFFIYAGEEVVNLILPLIFGAGFSVVGLLFAVLFVVLYGLNFKKMQ